MPRKQFVFLIALVIIAGGMTVAALAGQFGSPILPIIALVAALVGLILGRRQS